MASVYDPDAFAQRVNYAARCILIGGSRTRTRHFDTCFEMSDGELVVTALIRRAEKNPRLAQAIRRMMGVDGVELWQRSAAKWAHVPTRQLAAVARAEREGKHGEWLARHRVSELAPSGDQTTVRAPSNAPVQGQPTIAACSVSQCE